MLLENDDKYFQKKKYIKKNTKKFNHVILALFSGGFSTFSILYCVQSILPMFSQQFLLTPAESSLCLSASTGMMALGMLFIGPLSDVIGRKITMSASLILASILTIFCSMMTTWSHIILFRALTGLALSGVVSVAMTYISEEIEPNSLFFCMGLYISGNTIGGCSGRLLSSILSEKFSWNVALATIGIFSLLSSCFFLYCLPNSRNFSSVSINLYTFLKRFHFPLKQPTLLFLFTIGFILMGSFVTVFNYIGYRLITEPFFLSQSSIGFLSTIYLTGVYSSPKAGLLTHEYNRNNVLIASLILMLIGIFITQCDQLFMIIFGLTIFSAGFFASHSIASSWIGSYTKNEKVQSTSLYLFFYYLGSSIFGTFGGFFWFQFKWFGISVFIIIMLLLVITLSFTLKKIKTSS